LLLIGYVIIKYGRRHIIRTYEAAEPHVFADPILYIRPFSADKAIFLIRDLTFLFVNMLVHLIDRKTRITLRLGKKIVRYEEFLAYAFQRVGTLVTIGDPREKLPLLGATRIYARTLDLTSNSADEEWKTEIEHDIAAAKLILVHIGVSHNLRWELERIVKVAVPDRVVLCVNPIGPSLKGLRSSRARLKTSWKDFKEACGSIFPHGLPDTIDDARFVRFDANWNATPVKAAQRKIAWFIPGRNPDLSRRSVESVLAWMSWILTPESTVRQIARASINV
jgi:hypothetical protein